MGELEQKIEELRERFLQKLEGEDPGVFHPADVNRVKGGNDWLKRFLTHHDLDVNAALQMLWDTCEWRKSFGTNDINESNVKFLDEGGIFLHNKDIDGKALLIVKSKKHIKGQKSMEDLRKFTVYWLERCERTTKGDQISIFFDMAETGLSNMDMDYTKYLIGMFKTYYPDFLNYIIIFEMPWILNAAFKIIKTWLPAKAVQKIRFVSKTSLRELVPPDQMLTAWGGNDDFEYVFSPEERPDESRKKVVTFADPGSPTADTPHGLGESREGELLGSSLSIIPSDTITFVADGTELTGHFVLRNHGDKILSFKVKTTSPEKFRVRPSSGLLPPAASVSVSVVMLPGYQMAGFSRDKFLLMYLPVASADMTSADIADLWKQQGGKAVEQHRLKCALGAAAASDSTLRNGSAHGSGPPEVDRHVAQIIAKVNQLTESHSRLHGDVRLLQSLQWLTLLAVVVLAAGLGYHLLTQAATDVPTRHCYTGDL